MTCTATDTANPPNTSGPITFTVTVQRCNFTGFAQPVDMDKPNLISASQTIPLKFSLGGNYGLNILAAGSPSIKQVDCTSAAADEDTVAQLYTPPQLTYVAGADQYTQPFSFKNAQVQPGGKCYLLSMVLNTCAGTSHDVLFKTK